MIVLPVGLRIQSLEIDGKVGTLVPTFFMRPSTHFIIALMAIAIPSKGQVDPEQAIAKVFRVLAGEETNFPAKADSLLQNGAWEALAYIDLAAKLKPQKEDLQEAVPDYYRFKGKELIFKLIDPKDHNQYGFQGKLEYRWQKQFVLVINPKNGTERDRWKVLYLDGEYLALEMGDLRVFFAHTPPQEP